MCGILQQHQDYSGLPQGAPNTHHKTPNLPLLPETGKHINRMAGPYNSSKHRAGVEPVPSESRERDSQSQEHDVVITVGSNFSGFDSRSPANSDDENGGPGGQKG